MRSVFLVLVVLVLHISCAQATSNNFPIASFEQSLLKNAILVDVRTPEEFSQGHLEEAVNINWYDPDFATNFSKIEKEKTIYLYCKVGGRSLMAMEKLKKLGFKNVINLTGGYDAWIAK
ncbi:Rhodanese-related sulfurtransferase [Arenibacter nanhaiticus]|uniref:Rhodanese-related sulfurtransferase n=1 Tax=Arenibacter nanhaiticus TaxID=558155 RepID=A0A1M6ESW1_9FLAO|nr:rhodanese-like domain-containing protein [Arenibacter nanhaiticus]SHI88547.1 Rhodanese-related sulfurtransferase [Arenibacter nanhaiticus]